MAAVVLVLVGVLGAAAAPPQAHGASGTLRVVTATRYDVQPQNERVRVTIDGAATALTPDSAGVRTYFTAITFDVPHEAAHFSATSNGRALRIVHDARNDRVTLTFGSRVFFRQTYRYRVTFDLLDGGGAPDRDVRVSRSLVAFPVWAYGTENSGGNSVRIGIPAGYSVTVGGAELHSSSGAGGATVLTAGSIANPYTFFAYISGDRAGAFTSSHLSVTVGTKTAQVELRAWDDDPEWATRMRSLLRDGLPVLQRLIGLDYPVAGPVSVEEAATSRLGEYAGVYDSASKSITVRYDADAVVGLHEAAHIWFNRDLFRDRWIGEAFAEYYAVEATHDLALHGSTFALSQELLDVQIPLNDWGDVGVEKVEVEDFAYAATYHLAQLIADRAGTAGLQAVWRAASTNELAYQPVHNTAPDRREAVLLKGWQELLDLLENRTGTSYTDLWRSWVVNRSQLPMLERRERARASYQAEVKEARDWELPALIRYQMSSWQFTQAEAQLAVAHAALGKRDEIAERAAKLDLEPPSTLRSRFEDDGVKAALAEAAAELETLAAIDRANDAVAIEPTALAWLGLLGTDPLADLARARTAFESGDLPEADAQAAAAITLRQRAEDAGRLRVVVGGGGLLALDAAAMAGLALRRRRRRDTDRVLLQPTNR
jgi:hypothetical protein